MAANNDTDQNNPNEMTQEEWEEFYADMDKRMGIDFEDYMDHDHSMNG